MRNSFWLLVSALLLYQSLPTSAQEATSAWLNDKPLALGFKPDLEDRLNASLPAESPRITSVGILRNQKLLYTYYRDNASTTGYQQPTGPAIPQNMASVTKSVLGLLVGIALDKRIFTSVDDPISKYLVEAMDPTLAAPTRTVTVKHMLTMSSGWEGNASDLTPFLFADSLKRPFAFQPGEKFQYDNATSHLLGVALARAAGMPLERFAQNYLFGKGTRWVGTTSTLPLMTC
jgi:CubicO group peptidase (beta-lactamase class C family)